MDTETINLLILEDKLNDAELIVEELKRKGFYLNWKRVETEKEFIEKLKENPDIILADYMLPSFTGPEALQIKKELNPLIPLIIITGYADENQIVECMRAGATDYVLKDNLSRLAPVVRRALKEIEDCRKREKAERKLEESEIKYRTIFENTGTATVFIEENDIISLINTKFEELSGYSSVEIVNKKKWTEFIAPEDLDTLITNKINETSLEKNYEFKFIDKNKEIKNVFLTVDMIPGTKKSVASLLDITQRKSNENKTKHLNCLLHAIRNVNKLITENKDSQKLIKGICENFVENFSYITAWISIFDNENKYLFSAESGLGEKFIPLKEKLKQQDLTDCIIKAFDRNQIIITKNPLTECKNCPLSCEYKNRSVITSRLEYDGNIYGVASVSTSKDVLNNEEEQLLLKEVFEDISFALYRIRLETQQKRILETLRVSEEKHRSLYDFAPIPYQSLSEDGKLKDVNPAWLNILGYKRDEVIGKKFSNFLFPEEKHKFMNTFSAFKKKGSTHDMQYKLKCKNGSYIDVSYKGRIGYDFDGLTKQTYSVFQDITKQKEAKKKLMESEIRFKKLSNLTFEGLLIHKSNHVIDSNESLKRIFGYTTETICYYDDLSLYISEKYIPLVKKNIKKNIVKPYEVIAKKKDGSLFPIEIESRNVIYNNENFRVTAIRDITERKKAEEALFERKRVYQTLVNNLPGFIYRCNNNRKWTMSYISDGCTKITGYSPNEIIENKIISYNNIIDKQYRKQIWDIWQVILKKKSLFEMEYPIVTKEGKTRWVWERGCGVYSQNGDILFLEGFITDITERKKTEKAMQQSEEKMRMMINNSQIGFSTSDFTGRFIEVNPAFCKMIGYSSEELLHKHFNNFSHPDDLKINTKLHNDLLNNKISHFDLEKKFIHKNGSIVNALIRSQIVHDNQGKPLFEMAITEDITERKKVEKKLRESEEKLAQIVFGNSIATFVIDEKHKITHWNKACERLTGLSTEQMCGTKDSWKAFYPKKRPVIADIIIDPSPEKKLIQIYNDKFNKSSLIKNAYSAKDFFPNLGENGKWLFFTGTPIEDINGNIIGAIETLQDITESKQAEKIQKTLYNISSAINTIDNMYKLFEQIRVNLGEVIDTKNFFVVLYDEKTDMISLPFHVDEKDEFESFPAGKTLAKYVIDTGKPLYATTEFIEELTQKGIIESIGSDSTVWLGVPLKANNKVFGIISVQSYNNPDLYSEKDLDILTFVSEEISLSIQHKQSDEQVRKSLEEKEILLQEIYHRTNNNMAVVSSMLSMQARHSNNDFVKTTFKEIGNKIKAMSLVHQKLYQAKNLSKINLKDYIEDLSSLILQSYGTLSQKITIKFDLIDVNILIDSAIPLGLVLNELITNTFKHAYPNNKTGVLFIKLYQDEDYTINIHLEDNGIGLSEDINIRKLHSMGISTVFSIIEHQLKGKISFDKRNGMKWHIKIKDNLHEERI